MEREQELRKLINVLHRMTRTAARVQWMKTRRKRSAFCCIAIQQNSRALK